MPRRPVGDNVKELRGTNQPCRSQGDVVEFDALENLPEAPQYLDVRAKSYWQRIVPILFEKRVLTIADLEGLEVLCVLYGKVRQMAEAGVDISASCVTQLRLYQVEFGLTPASRSKLKAGEDGGKGNKFAGNGKKKA